MTGRLDGKIALVTGGSRGIGRGIALRLAREGCAIVAFTYRSDAVAAKESAAEIEAAGATAIPIRADLARADEAAALFRTLDAELTARTGGVGLDILVNNVGSAGPGTLTTTTPAQFDEIVAVNTRAPFFLLQEASSRLRDGGRVINISSAFSTRPSPGAPVYSMAKAAVNALSTIAAAEFGERGITVNTVSPGWTATDANAEARRNEQLIAGVARDTVEGRIAEPADVAGVVAMFAAPEGAWLTGQYVEANGRFRWS
ncbi:MAG TPA: SDR family oxidoreductase [Pseudonocardiaceae bacterium]|jgi:NAD(P)-dependent dehydrogenase (short-subunit alcohol dehydrogenase family)